MNALSKLTLSELEDRLAGRNGKAKCPAHEDRRESLTYSQGDGGRLLMRCHAGCSFGDVTAALNLHPAQLMPEDSPRGPRSTATAKAIKHSPKPRGGGFTTADEAIVASSRQFGRKPDLQWVYHDADGETVGHVLRWNTGDGGKDYRPISMIDGRWHLAAMPEPRPLYGLPEVLASSTTVWVTEGEKAADALRSVGLVATTSAGGG